MESYIVYLSRVSDDGFMDLWSTRIEAQNLSYAQRRAIDLLEARNLSWALSSYVSKVVAAA